MEHSAPIKAVIVDLDNTLLHTDKTLSEYTVSVLKKCGLYRLLAYEWDKITEAAFHDKKSDGDSVTVTLVKEPGSYELKSMKCLDVIEQARACLEGLTL